MAETETIETEFFNTSSVMKIDGFRFKYIIPTTGITIDGKDKDWADISIPEDTFDGGSTIDQILNISGTFVKTIKMAKDAKYFYFYMDFNDGNPNANLPTGYRINIQRPRAEGLTLGLINDGGSGKWRTFIDSHDQSGIKNTTKGIYSNNNGSEFKIGDNFIEVRFPMSYLTENLSKSNDYEFTGGTGWHAAYGPDFSLRFANIYLFDR